MDEQDKATYEELELYCVVVNHNNKLLVGAVVAAAIAIAALLVLVGMLANAIH